jgi:hypothetical protein
LAIVSFGVFLAHGFNGALARDLALYSYSGEQLANGVPPYVSVLNRAGPLAHVVPGIGSVLADWFGKDDVLTQRFLMTIISVLTVWVVYLVGRDLFRSRSAGAIAATTLLTVQGFMMFATGGPREKTTMMLFMALALWAIVHQRWGWAGACVALATLTWQPAFALGFTASLAAVSYRREDRPLRSIGWICLGGAVPTALTVIGFALAGALKPLVNCFLLINLHYTRQVGIIEYLRDRPSTLIHGYGPSIVVLAIGLPAAVITAIVLLRRPGWRDDPRARARIGFGAGIVVALLSSLKTFNGWPDALFMTPVAVLTFAGLVHQLVRRVPGTKAVAVTVAYCILVLAFAGFNAAHTSNDRLVAQRGAVRSIFDIAGQDASIVSIAAPAPLVLAHKTNPVEYQMFKNGFDGYVDDVYPGGLRGLADHLVGLKPTIFALDSQVYFSWILPTMRQDYVRVGRSADVAYWVRRDLGGPTISRLRNALHRYLAQEHP